jgi:hypothetical protein
LRRSLRVLLALSLGAIAPAACRRSGGANVNRAADAGAADAAPAPPAKLPIRIAEGKDEAPAAIPTAESTLASVPEHQRENGYAPAVETAYDRIHLLDRAMKRAHKGPTGPGMLVCEARTTKSVDQGIIHAIGFAEAADLDLEITWKGLTIKQRGPEDRQSATFTLPLLSLVEGDAVTVHLWDRDVRTRDDVGVVTATFAGELPFTKKAGQNTLACGHVPQAEIEKLAEEAIDRADKLLDETSVALDVDEHGDDLGQAWVKLRCIRATSGIAAYVGWSDPRVQRRTEWCQRMGRRIGEDAAAFVREAASKAKATSKVVLDLRGPALEIERPIRDCSPKIEASYRKRFGLEALPEKAASPCVVKLSVVNTGTSPFTTSSLAGDAGTPSLLFSSITPTGKTVKNGLLGIEGKLAAGPHQSFGPGERGTLVFASTSTDDVLTAIEVGPMLRSEIEEHARQLWMNGKGEAGPFRFELRPAYLLVADRTSE